MPGSRPALHSRRTRCWLSVLAASLVSAPALGAAPVAPAQTVAPPHAQQPPEPTKSSASAPGVPGVTRAGAPPVNPPHQSEAPAEAAALQQEAQEAAAEPDQTAEQVLVDPARAHSGPGPRFVKVLPARHNVDEIEATVGRELRLAFVIEHPQGLPMHVQALGLPHRATFDSNLRSIVWRPTEAELGVYQVRVVASDGVKQASHTLLIAVVPNRPPVLGSLWFEAVVGQPAGFLIQAQDPEQSAVELQVEGLPAGARFDSHSKRIHWVPTAGQVGVHPFSVRASDGQAVAVGSGQLSVHSGRAVAGESQEWTSFLLPGLGYSVYAPRDSEAADLFHGVNLKFLLATWIHRNDNRGPSHGQLYVNVELLDSTAEDLSLMFTYAGGLSLSFERNPTRSWLIPYYGLELGGMIQRELGAHFQATPYLGVHAYANSHVFVGLRGGYRLVPRRIDELAGFHAGLAVDFSVW